MSMSTSSLPLLCFVLQLADPQSFRKAQDLLARAMSRVTNLSEARKGVLFTLCGSCITVGTRQIWRHLSQKMNKCIVRCHMEELKSSREYDLSL